MMRLSALLMIGALAVLAPHESHATSVTGPNVFNDASGPNLLSFDLDVFDGSPLTVDVDLGGDTGPLTFNMLVSNFAPDAFGSFAIELFGGAEFDFVGQVTDGLGFFFTNVAPGSTVVQIGFHPNSALTLPGFEVGDPLGLSGALDWSIDVSNVVGGSFQMSLRPTLVPEPSLALLLGLGLAAWASLQKRARAS